MIDRRKKNMQWHVVDAAGSVYGNYDATICAILLDIRDELQTLNKVFQCRNFLDIPGVLRSIKTNTTKRKKK